MVELMGIVRNQPQGKEKEWKMAKERKDPDVEVWCLVGLYGDHGRPTVEI